MTPPSCGTCRHFENAPAAIERHYKGLTAMSSAYGSSRGEDGICRLHGLHVPIADCCGDFKDRKTDR
jgi:hypothetical protein